MARIDPGKVLWKEVDGLVIVLLIATGNFIELNKIGSAVWKQLAEGKGVDAIILTLKDVYDVTEAQLKTDVNSFISQMVKQGLLQE